MSKISNKLASLAIAGLVAISNTSWAESNMTVDSKGGVEVFNTANSDYWFKLSGRVLVDYAAFGSRNSTSNGFPSGAYLKNARLGFKGGVGSNWLYKIDVDVVDQANLAGGRLKVGEAFVGYNFCDRLLVGLGQISVPFGMESWTSATETALMENSLPSEAFGPDYGLGVYGEYYDEYYTLAGAVYLPPIGSDQRRPKGDIAIPGDDTLGFGARLTVSPIHDDYTVYHAALSGRYEKIHADQNDFEYISKLELRSRQSPVLFSNITDNTVHNHKVYGAELAGRWGPMLVSGEYMLAHVNRGSGYLPGDARFPGGNLRYHGYYVTLSYVLTGETKEYDYKSGTFGRVHPLSRHGAWELVGRHSYLDMLSGSQTPVSSIFFMGDAQRPVRNPTDMAGSAHSTAIGLTWWVNDNVRFLANYVRLSLPVSQRINAFGVRAQANF